MKIYSQEKILSFMGLLLSINNITYFKFEKCQKSKIKSFKNLEQKLFFINIFFLLFSGFYLF